MSDRMRKIIEALQGRPWRVGDRVILLDDLETNERPYFTGHEFVLEDRGERGWNVVDDNGNRIEDLSSKWFVEKE